MGMFFASKPGRATVVIPSAWLRRYMAEGFGVRPAPAGLPEVDVPTSLAEIEQLAERRAREAVEAASPAPAPEPAPEPASPAAKKKRGAS